MKSSLVKILCTLPLVFLAQSTLAETRESAWSWDGTTRNDEAMQGAAYAAACPSNADGQLTDVRLISFVVGGTDTQKKFGRPRKFKSWGTAVCQYKTPEEAAAEAAANNPEELPDLSCAHLPDGCPTWQP